MTSFRRAFTFVEISVVLVVLVLVSLVVAPRLTTMVKSQRVADFRLDAERAFRSARSLAVSRRQDTEVRWENGLVVAQAASTTDEDQEAGADEEGQTPALDRVTAPEGLIEFSRGLVNGEEQGQEDWTIRFSATGSSDAGGIEFTSLGRTFWVRVDAQAKISTGEGELEDPGTAEWDAGDLEQRIEAGQ